MEIVSYLKLKRETDFQIRRISDIFRNEESIRILRVFVNGDSSGSDSTKFTDQPERNISVLFTGHNEMNQLIQSIVPSDDNPWSTSGYNKLILLDNEHKIL